MIGMSQIKKKLYTGMAIGGGIGLLGIGLVLWWSIANIKTYEEGTNNSFNNKYTKMVYVLNADTVQGQMITDDMLTEQRVHNKMIPAGSITSKSGASRTSSKI